MSEDTSNEQPLESPQVDRRILRVKMAQEAKISDDSSDNKSSES